MPAKTLSAPVGAPATGLRPVWPLLATLVLLFGASWPVAKLALATGAATPAWLAASRSALACVTLLALLAALGRLRLPRRRDLPSLLAIGVLQLSGFFALCHFAVEMVPAGRTAILANAAIVWVVPIAALMGEVVPRRRWLAAVLWLLGIVTLAGPWAIDWRQGPLVLGHALLLLAALAWAVAIMVTRLRPPELPALEMLPWAFALSTVLLVGLALWREPAGGVGPAAWPHALFNGAVVAPIGTWCLVELSRRLAPVVSAVLLLIVPAAGVLISAWALNERIGPDLMFGGALIAAGVVLAALTPAAARPA